MGAGAAKIPLGFLALNPEAPLDVKTKQWEYVKSFMIDRMRGL